MPAPNGRKKPLHRIRTKPPKPYKSGPPDWKTIPVPPGQQGTINADRYLATLNRLRKKLELCYTIGRNGKRVLLRHADMVALNAQITVFQGLLREAMQEMLEEDRKNKMKGTQ